MKTAYSRILAAAYSTIWVIEPNKLNTILGFLELKAAGLGPSVETIAKIEAANLEAARRADSFANTGGSVAVLPLYGLISHRASMMNSISGPGGTSCQKFGAQLHQAVSDPGCKAIVIDVDSPGGMVEGVAELAADILQARGKKPIIAVSDCLMASAAYWICSACSEIVVSPSSQTGSIGVYTAHVDESKALDMEGVKKTLISYGKYKTEGNPYEPLTDEAQTAMQRTVDAYGEMFVRAVAKGRGVSADAVRGGFAQGRMATAQEAVDLGMADRIATLDQVLEKYGVNRSNGVPMDAAAKAPVVRASAKADGMECECPCEPCIGGDCSICDHEACDCAGCTCPTAEEMSKKAKRSAISRRLQLASL
jgi:signal peptide peptidase SppA